MTAVGFCKVLRGCFVSRLCDCFESVRIIVGVQWVGRSMIELVHAAVGNTQRIYHNVMEHRLVASLDDVDLFLDIGDVSWAVVATILVKIS